MYDDSDEEPCTGERCVGDGDNHNNDKNDDELIVQKVEGKAVTVTNAHLTIDTIDCKIGDQLTSTLLRSSLHEDNVLGSKRRKI